MSLAAIREHEAFKDAMELLDCARMCGVPFAKVGDLIVNFLTDEGFFDANGNIHRNFIRARPQVNPKDYQPRNDPSKWTPRLPDREWWPLRGLVFQRDGYVCTYCKDEDGPFQIDHIVPVTRGGSNEPDNLCVACKPCNSSKGDRLLSEWRGRYR